MSKAVVYARYSSHSQTEQSIEGQVKVCREYAERQDIVIIDYYIDEAFSGTSDNRPAFQKMLKDAARRQFEYVLVYQLDRFARNRYDSANAKATLKKYGVRVLSAKENISDDASGILMESVLEGMAEYYSAELSQKIRRGMEINAEKGLAIGGQIILGYKVVDKKFVIDPGEAEIVRKIFEMYLNKSTMAEIIRYLNAQGVKTSMGNPYNKNSIRRILQNKKYKGVYTFRGEETPDGMPRIIDDDTFEAAQIMLEKNKKAPARAKAKDEEYILSAKLFCGHCESGMIGISGTSKTGKIHQYYICVGQRRHSGCQKSTVQKQYIEDLVVNEVRSILTPENIDKIARKAVELAEKERNTDTLKRLHRLLRENETATDNLIKALEAGKAVDIIAAQIEKRQKEHKQLEAQIAKEEINFPVVTVPQVKFFLEQFRCGDINDIKYRQSLIDVFVSKIYLFDTDGGKNKKLTIICNTGDSQLSELTLNDLEGSYKGHMVEMGGVEPPSESALTGTSPGADGYLNSLSRS